MRTCNPGGARGSLGCLGAPRALTQKPSTPAQNLGSVPCAAAGGKPAPVLVTLNPPNPPAAALTHASWRTGHPMPTLAAAAAKRRLGSLQGSAGRVFYAGAWAGYGFHEDGFKAGAAAAAAAGGRSWVPLPNPPQFGTTLRTRLAKASCHAFLRSFIQARRPDRLLPRLQCPAHCRGSAAEAEGPSARTAAPR